MQQLSNLLKSRRARGAAVATGVALGLLSTIVAINPASADPKSATALVGVGSDTTQDVMNALAGENNGILYTPAVSSSASGRKQIASWDATPVGTCITTKAGFGTLQRPNGSTNGRRALSRTIGGGTFGSGTACGGAKSPNGMVDFARSSSGPSGPGTDLTYVPFGRDALTFAYFAKNVANPATTLTSTELQEIFKVGPITKTVNGQPVQIFGCRIQSGSGTYQSWNTSLGVATGDIPAMLAATTACSGPTGDAGALQENDAAGLAAKGNLAEFDGKQVIVGFSAANFISQTNGRAVSQLAVGANLGAIDSLGVPVQGTAPNLTPNPTFYASTTYGRDVYNVLPTSKVGGLAASNQDFKSLFVGPTSAICSTAAQQIVNLFGFATPTDDPAIANDGCGSITLQGPLVS